MVFQVQSARREMKESVDPEVTLETSGLSDLQEKQ